MDTNEKIEIVNCMSEIETKLLETSRVTRKSSTVYDYIDILKGQFNSIERSLALIDKVMA